MDQSGRLWSSFVSHFLQRAKACITHGAVMSYNVLWVVQLRKDILGQDFAQFNAHLV